jgi:hypothetical protein
MVQIRKWEMIESIEANSYMSIDVEKWLEGMKNSFIGDKISKKSTKNAFTVFHGVLLQCQVNWNGRVIRGNDIPQELKELLKDETIYKCQFNVLGDATLLRSMGITINNIVEMRNVALECFPQRELANCSRMRDGKGFMAEKLDSPVVFYTHGKKVPLRTQCSSTTTLLIARCPSTNGSRCGTLTTYTTTSWRWLYLKRLESGWWSWKDYRFRLTLAGTSGDTWLT